MSIGNPQYFEQFQTFDWDNSPSWWTRALCVDNPSSCALLLLQHHSTPSQIGDLKYYDVVNDLIVGLVTGTDAKAIITAIKAGKPPEVTSNLALRRVMSMLSQGIFNDIVETTIKERGLTQSVIGTSDLAWAEFLDERVVNIGYTETEIAPDFRKWVKGI